ncbi:MAG: helix-turn-helix domain-containing protein [Candidatus Bipolaricaulia bacterium]
MAERDRGTREWLTVAEAADYLRVSRDTVYRWAREGRITLYKLGGLTRLKHRELEALIAPKAKGKGVDPWTALSQEAFSDWDNPEDAIYDRWEELYGLSEG